jgi:hypothetical protein
MADIILSKRVIESVGVEIECGIRKRAIRKLQAKYSSNFEVTTDGSVEVYNDKLGRKWVHNAELKYWNTDIRKVLEFARDVFKLGAKQNSTCGNHIHIRLSDQNIALILWDYSFIQEFLQEYIKEFKDNRKYMDRLNNRYCRAYTNSKEVERNIKSQFNRYYAINFFSVFERQNTVEIRLMPFAESFKEYKKQLLWTIRTIRKLLRKRRFFKITIFDESLINLELKPTFVQEIL